MEAYSPLAHGERMQEPVLHSLGKKHGKSPAQIMIRWGLQRVRLLQGACWLLLTHKQGFVPLPKSATPARIAQNADIFDFELSGEDMKSLQTGDYSPTDWDPTVDFD